MNLHGKCKILPQHLVDKLFMNYLFFYQKNVYIINVYYEFRKYLFL